MPDAGARKLAVDEQKPLRRGPERRPGEKSFGELKRKLNRAMERRRKCAGEGGHLGTYGKNTGSH